MKRESIIRGSDWRNYHHEVSVGPDTVLEGQPEYAFCLPGKGQNRSVSLAWLILGLEGGAEAPAYLRKSV